MDPPVFSHMGHRLVIRPSRKKKDIADIQSWSQAFAIFALVLTTYFPHRSSDLLRYQGSGAWPGRTMIAPFVVRPQLSV